jgi:hypothetical protein
LIRITLPRSRYGALKDFRSFVQDFGFTAWIRQTSKGFTLFVRTDSVTWDTFLATSMMYDEMRAEWDTLYS